MTKTLEQLQTEHAEMIATAHDLGMNVPDDLKQDFRTVEAGSTVVSSLDTLIRAWREKLPSEQGGSAPQKGETATEKRLRLKAERLAAEADKTVAPVAGKAQGVTRSKKKSAEAAPANAKPEKEPAMAKKAAKKKVAKKKAGNGGSPIGRSKYTDEMKISAKHKDMMSTARAGTGWHDRLKAINTAVGKTVAAFKGSRGDLKVAVDKGLITVK